MRALPLLLLGIAACGDPGADLVLRGGVVHPMTAAGTPAQAVAIRADTIVFVGADSAVTRWIGRDTRVVNLAGRAVLPGFHDAHVHPVKGGLQVSGLDLTDAGSVDSLLALVARYARAHPDDAWITGRGWQLPLFPDANPHRRLLDAIEPDRPVFLIAMDGHSAWANSAALAAAGVDAATPDPPGGRIERGPGGAPSGTLRERATALVARLVPPPDPEDHVRALEAALRRAAALGITGLHDARAGAQDLAAYRTLAARGALTAHVTASVALDPDTLRGPPEPAPPGAPPYFRVSGFKLFLDGVLEAQTAALLEPYLTAPRDRGPTMIARETLLPLVAALDARGDQLHFHAIGDRAVRDALDAVAHAAAVNGPRDRRPLLAHLQLIHPDDLPRFAALGAIAVFQPLWAYRDTYITELTEPRIGPARSARLYPIGSVVRAGGRIAGGSDWPVTSLDPWRAIEVAVTRRAPGADRGAPWLPGETVSLRTALEAYTINAAYATHLAERTGSLEVGKAADLIVVDRDPFAVPATALHTLRVLLTVFAGTIVYDGGGSAEQGTDH